MARRTNKSPKKHGIVKNYLVPHEGNEYHPKLFRMGAVGTLLIALFLFEGLYLADTKLALTRTNFLASVLPAALLDLTNADRAASGVAPLVQDPELAKAAQLKANDMAEKGYFAHVSPEGRTPWSWLDQIGYSYSYAGENLAINFDDSTAVEEAWMNSPTHHANLVKPQYTRVGYAVAQGIYQGRQTTFVVQEFAAKPSDEFITQEVKPKSTLETAVTKIVEKIQPKTPEAKPAPEAQSVEGASIPADTAPAVQDSAPAASDEQAQTETPVVLGSQTNETYSASNPFVDFMKRIAASPTHTSTYLLGALAAILSILLITALFLHARVRYLEVLSGGLVIIIFVLSVLVYNALHSQTPVVPDGTDSSLSV